MKERYVLKLTNLDVSLILISWTFGCFLISENIRHNIMLAMCLMLVMLVISFVKEVLG